MIIKFFSIYKLFLLLDLKRTFLRRYFVFVELITIYLTVVIYYYSSQAFAPREGEALNFYGMNLFAFLFWGDILLKVPQNLFHSPLANIKQAINENTFESMVLFSGSLKKILVSLSMMETMRELLSIFLMIFVAYAFFDLDVSLFSLLHILLILLAFIPVFLGLGLLISGVVFHFERGENSLYLISNIMALLAGMYFPTQVFPQVISELGKFLTPYAYFLRLNRETLQTGVLAWPALAIVLSLGMVLFWLGLHFAVFILNRKKSQGRTLIIG